MHRRHCSHRWEESNRKSRDQVPDESEYERSKHMLVVHTRQASIVQQARSSRLAANIHGTYTTPQGQDTILFDRLDKTIRESIVNLSVHWLIHQSSAQVIGRRDGTRHEESSNKGRTKGRSNILAFPSGQITNMSLGNVVDTHFGGIQDTCTHDIDRDTTVETRDSLIFVHLSHQGSKRNRASLVGLGQRFL